MFCTFLRRGGGPLRMCKICLPDEALYYYTLLYWGEGSGRYNCWTTRSCIIGPYHQRCGPDSIEKDCRSACRAMWNSRSPCGAESVAGRRSSHCWTSWLALDKENHWRSMPAVAPGGWVQLALHNLTICCSQSPLDGDAQNDLGIESSQAVTDPTICGAKPCLTSMITWQALYTRPYRFSL